MTLMLMILWLVEGCGREVSEQMSGAEVTTAYLHN